MTKAQLKYYLEQQLISLSKIENTEKLKCRISVRLFEIEE